jgi:hypothetical protein
VANLWAEMSRRLGSWRWLELSQESAHVRRVNVVKINLVDVLMTIKINCEIPFVKAAALAVELVIIEKIVPDVFLAITSLAEQLSPF